MKIKHFMVSLALLVLVFAFTASAHASLVDNLDGTVTQTRVDSSVLMWLKDANHAMTSGFDTDGLMNKADADTWIATLNSSVYLGYSDWRLPDSVPPIDGVTFDYTFKYDGSTDQGYNLSAPGSAYPGSTSSDLANMYYTELGNKGYFDLTGVGPQAGWGLKNVKPFTNLTTGGYWSSTLYVPDPTNSFSMDYNVGKQDLNNNGNLLYAWAMRSATEVPVIPEPISSTLFVLGAGVFGARIFFRKYS